MSDDKAKSEPTLVEKWIRDQQEWHKMATEYFDSMVKNDEFLTHLGNAMRGSLLAGKPYPGTEAPPEPKDEAEAADDRLDVILHTLHRLEGDVADLKMAVDDLLAEERNYKASAQAAAPPPTPGGFERGRD